MTNINNFLVAIVNLDVRLLVVFADKKMGSDYLYQPAVELFPKQDPRKYGDENYTI